MKAATSDGGQHLVIYLPAGGELSGRQIAHLQNVLRKIVFPIVEHAALSEKHNGVCIEAFADIAPNALESSKYQVRPKAQETLHATISNIRSMSRDLIR